MRASEFLAWCSSRERVSIEQPDGIRLEWSRPKRPFSNPNLSIVLGGVYIWEGKDGAIFTQVEPPQGRPND